MLIAIEDQVTRMMARLGLDYSGAIKSTEDFSKTLAKLDADLARFRASTLKGISISGLDEMSGFVSQMRQAIAAGTQLTDQQKRLVLTAKEWAYIQTQDIQRQQIISKAIAEQAKTRQNLATIETSLANQKALAEQKANERTYLRVPALQAEIASVQASLQTRGLESSELVKQANLLRAKIDLLERERAAGKEITVGMTAQTQEIERQLAVLRSQAQTASADIAGTGKKGETFWERRFGWFLSGSLFYGSMRLAKDVLANMTEIESGMTTIRRVSNETTADFAKMQNELLSLGVEFGQTWDVVSDIAVRWSQAGYSVKDTIELTRTSLMALNTAELDVAQSSKGFVALMAQWGLTAEDLLSVLDRINIVADRFAVSSGDLIDGLSRSSGAAKVLGLDLEQTISLLTVMAETTGRSGREIGNALNSILSFVQRPSAINVFEAEGVKVYMDTTRTQLRNVMDIFGEMAARWPQMADKQRDALVEVAEQVGLYSEEIATLTDTEDQFTQVQQRNISQASAGVYRRNYLLALLQNWSKIDEVLITQENALGYSLAENEKRMSTKEAKIRSLQAAWQDFSTAFADAGILDVLKGLADGATLTVTAFNGLPPAVKAAVASLITYGTVVSAVNAGTKMLAGKTIGQLIGGLTGAKQVGFLATGGSVLSGVLPWIPAAIAGASAISALVRQHGEYQQQLEAAARAYAEAETALSKYTGGTVEHERAQEDMSDLIQEIGEKYPSLITKIDEHGRVLEIDTEHLLRHDQAIRNTLSPLDELKDKYADVTAELALLNEEYRRLTTGQSSYVDRSQTIDEGLAPTTPVPDDIRRQQVIERMLELGKTESEIRDELARRGIGKASTSDGGTGLSFDYDAWGESLSKITESYTDYDLALIETRKNLRLLEAEEESLTETAENEARMREITAQKTRLLVKENELLESVNGTLLQRLGQVYELQSQAAVAMDDASQEVRENAAEAYSRATGEIRSLTQEIADNSIAIYENKIAIGESGKAYQEFQQRIRDAARESFDSIYNLVKKTFDYQVRMFNTHRDLQIAHYRSLLPMYQDDQDKRWEIEENLQRLYRDALEEETDMVKEAYWDRLEALEDSMDKEIAKYQKKIDALDDIEKKSDRSEAARQHSEKIKELEEKIAYERLRTGIEHERNIADYTKQIQEENIRWELQREEWARDDKREGYEEEIDDIKEAYDEKREELERAWKETEAFLNDEFVTVLSMASAFDDSWYQKGLDWASQLAQGFQSGMSGLELGELTGEIGQGVSHAGSSASSRQANEALLAAKKAWERAHAAGDESGMRNAAAAAKAIRDSHSTIDPHNQMSAAELEEAIRKSSFDTGGLSLTEGWAKLHPGELVLKADLSTDLLRNLRNVTTTNSRTVYNINSPLVRIEAEVNDRADADYIINAVDRHIKDLVVARGGVAH